MEHNVLYFNNRLIRFITIDNKFYVSLSDVKIRRPNPSIIKQTLLNSSYGYLPIEVIEVSYAINATEDKMLADFLTQYLNNL